MIIDVRETELIKLVKYFLENNANYKDIQLKIERQQYVDDSHF